MILTLYHHRSTGFVALQDQARGVTNGCFATGDTGQARGLLSAVADKLVKETLQSSGWDYLYVFELRNMNYYFIRYCVRQVLTFLRPEVWRVEDFPGLREALPENRRWINLVGPGKNATELCEDFDGLFHYHNNLS
jgi:hypothetical protein